MTGVLGSPYADCRTAEAVKLILEWKGCPRHSVRTAGLRMMEMVRRTYHTPHRE